MPDEYKYNEEKLTFDPVRKNRKYLKSFFRKIHLVIILIFLIYPFVMEKSNEKLDEKNETMAMEYDKLLVNLNNSKKELEKLRLRDDSIYSSVFGIKPLDNNIYKSGTGGVDDIDRLRLYKNPELLINATKEINKLSAMIKVYSKRLEKIEELSKKRCDKLNNIPAIQPIYNKDLIRTSSGFGYRTHPVYKVKKFHSGMDFVASKGTDVYATGDGVVVSVKTFRTGYGKHIIISHDYGYKSLYAHLSGFNVKKGQKIKRGDIIGYVGNTGTSTGTHLHYEVIKNGRKVNPSNYYFNDITPEEYLKIVELSNNITKSMD